MYIRLLLFVITLGALKVYNYQNLKLVKVIILSRHNVRTPLSKNLFEFTPRTWPTWKAKNGYLTEKGMLLEGFMGEFFSSWLVKEGLLDKECPDENSLYVYANTAQRTIASAEAFLNKAYPMCNVTVHHTTDSQRDPIFNPVIHNSSKIFKNEAIKQMQVLLKSLHLNSSYEEIEKILDYKNSTYCTLKHKCDLTKNENKIFVDAGFKPNLEGPLKISKSVIDSFIMENYEGFPIDQVAWGKLQNIMQWNTILDLTRSYHNVIFNTTLVARDVAKPLIKFMYDLFINPEHKVSLLMGHDANIYTVLNSMGFKPFSLRNQYEVAPAGGKIVFQKWLERNTGKYYAKIEYVYQNTDDMRAGRELSLANPPEFTLLQLNDCEINENGLCPWDNLLAILNTLIN